MKCTHREHELCPLSWAIRPERALEKSPKYDWRTTTSCGNHLEVKYEILVCGREQVVCQTLLETERGRAGILVYRETISSPAELSIFRITDRITI